MNQTYEDQLGRSVRHVSGAQQTGIITAICIRSYGVSYGVTWSDLAERWHAPSELLDNPEQQKTIKIIQP